MVIQDTFAQRLINWYAYHKRDLPWRHTRDPYQIWLSEIILQQTRVKQGLPYYRAFAEHFPTIFDLATASEQEVLRLWQGLGYYSRARNMQQTAKFIVNQYNGIFPDTYEALLKLKGVGPYTAAAIASFAFKEAVAVLDGNVYRVLARLFGIETDIASQTARITFSALAHQLISHQQPDEYNQAIMEFGAIQCTPVAPDCLLCPFQQECEAYLTGRQSVLPIKSKKATVKKRFFHYIVLLYEGQIAMRLRGPKDIWQGLYDFMLIEKEDLIDTADLLMLPEIMNLGQPDIVQKQADTYTHTLTHQRIEARFWHLTFKTKPALPEQLKFFDLDQTDHLPKPVLIGKYLNKHFL